MKIENEESVKNLSSLLKSSAEKEAKTKTVKETEKSDDQVQLSPRAMEFQRIKDVLETVPEVREEKVAELTESIKKGAYKPDTQKTAENLIKESLIDLLA